MQDILIYCNDLKALKKKLRDDGYYNDRADSYDINHTLTSLKYNGNTSLSYVRNCVLDLDDYDMLESLGDYDEMESDEVKRAKYLSVYDYEKVQSYINEAGIVVEYSLPHKLGVFA